MTVRHKTYSDYGLRLASMQRHIEVFLERNGFTFLSVLPSSQQIDARSFLQNITLVYEDNGKPQTFDNIYWISGVGSSPPDFNIYNKTKEQIDHDWRRYMVEAGEVGAKQ